MGSTKVPSTAANSKQVRMASLNPTIAESHEPFGLSVSATSSGASCSHLMTVGREMPRARAISLWLAGRFLGVLQRVGDSRRGEVIENVGVPVSGNVVSQS